MSGIQAVYTQLMGSDHAHTFGSNESQIFPTSCGSMRAFAQRAQQVPVGIDTAGVAELTGITLSDFGVNCVTFMFRSRFLLTREFMFIR